MLKNYLKLALRNMRKYKSYSFINIFGLSIGIACCILILAYIGYEFSFDGYHKNADNIYRVVSQQVAMGKTRELAISPAPVGATLVKDYPEGLDSARFMPTVKRIFIYEDKSFFQEGVIYADQSVFNVFSFDMIEGDPATALEVPFTMVITEKTAQKYFGDENPVGKIMNWDNKFDYRITGVVKDPPPNSHFTFSVLASFATLIKYDARLGSWRGASFQTYLLMQDNTDLKEFDLKIAAFNEKYLAPMFKEMGTEVKTWLQPLKSIHLHSHLEYELGVNSDIKVITVFSTIAFVILLIACINFMNLATARSSGLAKEVGLRKVLGAERRKLIFQFLGESFVFTFFSLLLAIVLAQLFLPYFRFLTGRDIGLNFLQSPFLYLGLVGIVLFVGLIAGSYPAFFLSAFSPVLAIKGMMQHGSKGKLFRSLLVVFQFAISIILIIGTLIIFNQQTYLKDKNLGFDKDNTLVLILHNEYVRLGLESFKNEVLKINGVASAGSTSMVPGEGYLFNTGTRPEGFAQDQTFRMEHFLVDYGYLDSLKINVTKGRGYSQEILTDKTNAIMINETAAAKLEWDDPVGRIIDINWYDTTRPSKKIIIGVFADIHQRSLYSVVEPTFIQYISDEGPIENRARRLTLHLEAKDTAGTLNQIEGLWKETYPHIPFYYFFLDEFFLSQHRAEEKLGGIFRAFAILAVLIGCVGLFGLVSFMAEKRTREIGIRKVLGSPVRSIVALLCRQFLFLVIISNVIAWPVAFLVGKKWLQKFPYAVDIKLSIFIITAMLTFVLALITVGYKSLKAARANPVDTLRYE